MKIDVTELKRHLGGEAEYSFAQPIGQLDQFGETITFEPASVKVKLLNVGDSITAFFHANAMAHVRCSRCLEPYDEPISIDFQIVYREIGQPSQEDEQDAAEDVVTYERALIDVSEDVEQQVVLALPMKPVCDQDCKGLCPSCGHNLNLGKCSCPEVDVDARWTVLGDLFKKD